jgi:hypothetical protein
MKKQSLIWILIALFTPLTVLAACGNETTACGWNELFDGNIVTAAFVMYDTAFVGWTVAILFFVYQFILLLKTRNLTLSWVTGVLFAGMYVSTKLLDATGNPVLKPISAQVIFALLVIELGAIIYLWLWK